MLYINVNISWRNLNIKITIHIRSDSFSLCKCNIHFSHNLFLTVCLGWCQTRSCCLNIAFVLCTCIIRNIFCQLLLYELFITVVCFCCCVKDLHDVSELCSAADDTRYRLVDNSNVVSSAGFYYCSSLINSFWIIDLLYVP